MAHDHSRLWGKTHVVQGLHFYQVRNEGWRARDDIFGYVRHDHWGPFIIAIFLAPANFVLEAWPIRFEAIQGLQEKPSKSELIKQTVQRFPRTPNSILRLQETETLKPKLLTTFSRDLISFFICDEIQSLFGISISKVLNFFFFSLFFF